MQAESHKFTIGAIAAGEYDFIRKLVYDRSRINLGPNKMELVRSRLHKRLQALGLTSFDDYCRLLNDNGADTETRALLDAISTNVTSFFRDEKQFEFLQTDVYPQWEKRLQRNPHESLRLWSAACSSGEEPYSLAILLVEFFRARPQLRSQAWEIFASDISSRMLAAAEKGVYRRERVKMPDSAWLHRYFQKGVGKWEEHCRLKSEIRAKVKFSHLNLVENPYPGLGKFDVIFCRNVMIYFDAPTQKQLVPRLVERLKPGGFLFVGAAEKLPEIHHGMKCLRPTIYQLS